MIRFTNTIQIERRPAEVFDYLSDLEHIPEWNWAIESTRKVSPGLATVGSRYRQTRSVPRRGEETLEITGLEPGRRIELAGTLGPFGARLAYDVEPDAGGSRLTNSVELEPPGLLGFAGPILGTRVRSSVAENLTTLKRVLESR